MECSYFGICGSCKVYDKSYDEQLDDKFQRVSKQFFPFYKGNIEMFASKSEHFRSRAEFRIYHIEDTISFAMHKADKSGVVQIDACPIVSMPIKSVMDRILPEITDLDIAHKLFGMDFLSAQNGEVTVSLIYHKALDDSWQEKARILQDRLGVNVIGRSRKQKIVLSKDYVTESLSIDGMNYHFHHIENSFTQPNAGVNEQMIGWALKQLDQIGGDLLELYCGAGNFTIPFASKFDRVLATEISKSSIYAAKENMKLNNVENIDFVRMSAEEFTQALDGVRKFNRMEGIDIGSYHLNTLFVDPPRSGLGDEACAFASRFDHLLYISCNPETLLRDLSILEQTHNVTAMAGFDQFPYTHHLEMGVMLVKKG